MLGVFAELERDIIQERVELINLDANRACSSHVHRNATRYNASKSVVAIRQSIRRPPGHRSPQHPREGDEGCEDDCDDSDEGNGAVNVGHDGHRIPRNEKAAGSISSGPLGSKLCIDEQGGQIKTAVVMTSGFPPPISLRLGAFRKCVMADSAFKRMQVSAPHDANASDHRRAAAIGDEYGRTRSYRAHGLRKTALHLCCAAVAFSDPQSAGNRKMPNKARNRP